MKLQINNNRTFHLEVIESLIVKHEEIVKKQCDEIILNLHPHSDPSFIKYIIDKYNNVHLGHSDNPDYQIHATCYKGDIEQINQLGDNHFFICHTFDDDTRKNDNIFYLTPLAKRNYFKPNILPNIQKIKTEVPVYVVQGNIESGRRKYSLTIDILENTKDLQYELRFIGRGRLYQDIAKYEKVKHFANFPFIEYHQAFHDAYCVLPLITKESNPHYYESGLTSTISYITGYNFPCIIDADLQSIYNLDNAYVFEKEEDLVSAFIKSHEDFYK